MPVEEKRGGISTKYPTYLLGLTIRSKVIIPEKLQQTSNLKEQVTTETCQAGAPPSKRG